MTLTYINPRSGRGKHIQAREQWDLLRGAGAKLHTSVPIVIETFASLDRNANRDVALAWKDALDGIRNLKILPSELRDLEQSRSYFRRGDLHNLSAVGVVRYRPASSG